MNQKAMQPFGLALLAYYEGDQSAQVTIRRDDGLEDALPISYFFRSPSDFSAIERAAIAHCRGRILDVGAGTGLHSLALQQSGATVTAIDISPQAVSVMQQRGVKDVRCADIFEFDGGSFDTLLMMGHGIGMVKTIAGLERFLLHARNLLAEDGQMLFDSLDIRKPDNPLHLAYQQANRRAGRYFGEVRTQMEYQGVSGPWSGWLHVDSDTLSAHAVAHGWQCKTLLAEENGDYLAQLKFLTPGLDT